MARVAALLLLALALGGCLSTSQPPLPGPGGDLLGLVPLPEAPIVQDHEHDDVALHQGAANLARVAYHSGYGAGAGGELPTGQGFSELAVWEGERGGEFQRLVLLGRRDGPDGGFVVLDASNPHDLVRLGEYPGLANYDIEVSEDGAFAFFTTQWLFTQQGGGEPDPRHDQRAVYLVDLGDPAQPRAAGIFYPPTRGAHTITYHRMEGGRELLLVNTYDFLPDPSLGLPVAGLGSNPLAHRVLITEFVREPAPHLEVLSVFEKTSEVAPVGQDYFPHDTFVQEHPLTRQLLLYVSYWDLGAFLVDISDPAMPREVGRLDDFTPSKHRSIHFARPAPALIDGVHVTVTEPELGPTDETGQLTFFDTTDPANPKRLGHWTLPGELVITEGLIFSPHNFDIQDGRVYLAHYHGGVWVLDISSRDLLDRPAALAYYQGGVERPDPWVYAPEFWSAVRRGGLVYASDMSAGLQVLRYAGDAP